MGPAARRTSASIRDVASRAGVSGQTVSRVARGEGSVRPDTRARVLAAMEELGYTPNTAARALRSGATHTLGVVAHRVARTGEAHTIQGIIEAARARGFAVMIADSPTLTGADVSAQVGRLAPAVDGLVLLLPESGEPEGLELPGHLPVVVTGATRDSRHDSVGCDDVGGAARAVTHLLGMGHASVHHVSGPQASAQAALRERGWRDTLAAHGREAHSPLRGDWTPASGYRAGLELAQDDSVTGIFCANDEMAAGVLRALHEGERRVPGDVSVVGFDDVLAPYLWPPLTSVVQDFEEIGRELIRVLLARIGHDVAGEGRGTRSLVATPLRVRASSGPPVGSGTLSPS